MSARCSAVPALSGIELTNTAATVAPYATVTSRKLIPLPGSAPFLNWKRTTVFATYVLSSLQNNTDGPFSPPPTGTPTSATAT